MIERIDRPGERFEVAIGETLANGGSTISPRPTKPLTRGGVYRATLGASKVTFKVDAKAKVAKPVQAGKQSEKLPVVSRLLRFPPG